MTKPIPLLSLFFLCAGLLCAGLADAQPRSNPDFAVYAGHQDSLFIDAYEQRDTTRYERMLSEFEEKFNRLTPSDQKKYAANRSSAYYNLSCTYGILGRKQPALDWLEKAIRAGYSNYPHMLVDRDLVSIRDEERFAVLLAPLRETNDYLYILGKAGRYNDRDTRPLPRFTYQPADDPNLVSLRKTLKLDSVAGGGDEVSRVLNLLHWMHNQVPHDGNGSNPEVKNALNMITVCKRDHATLNCRGLAIALNECYLSLGIPARYLTCQPKDSLKVDPDCHVINIVYLRSLRKWVWVDPTNDAYVMNEKGELLGPEEVRQRLIDHRPLILNPDANWNHRSTVVKEEYLYSYMAKNLYLLQCPVESRYDLETFEAGKTYTYVQLLPLDYFAQGPDKSERDYGAGKGRMVNYHTNDPGKFWAAP